MKHQKQKQQTTNNKQTKMPFGQISTHPLRQVLIDLSIPAEDDNEIYSYTLNTNWFVSSPMYFDSCSIDGRSHLWSITIEAHNRFEAAVLLYDYFNMKCSSNEDLYGVLDINIWELSTFDEHVFTVDDKNLILSHIHKLFNQHRIKLTNNIQNYVLK